MSSPRRRTWPRTLWNDWDEAHTVPELLSGSWQSMTPGWEVRRVSQASSESLLDAEGYARVFESNLGVVHASDALRIELLCWHGGVWADATTLCTRPLDDWPPDAMGAGFFAFRCPEPERPLATWFLASERGGDLICRLRPRTDEGLALLAASAPLCSYETTA